MEIGKEKEKKGRENGKREKGRWKEKGEDKKTEREK